MKKGWKIHPLPIHYPLRIRIHYESIIHYVSVYPSIIHHVSLSIILSRLRIHFFAPHPFCCLLLFVCWAPHGPWAHFGPGPKLLLPIAYCCQFWQQLPYCCQLLIVWAHFVPGPGPVAYCCLLFPIVSYCCLLLPIIISCKYLDCLMRPARRSSPSPACMQISG